MLILFIFKGKWFVGKIEKVEKEVVEIESKEKILFDIPFGDIVKAKLEIDWDAELEKDSGFYR